MQQVLAKNWFYLVAGGLVLCVWTILRFALVDISAADYASLEAALMVDALVTLPLLYWLCFRKFKSAGALTLRMIAVICGGLWLAGWIVPEQTQVLLAQLSWLRPIMLGGLILVEVRFAFAAFRLVSKPGSKASDLRAVGVPPLVARLMLAEAKFWRWAFSLFRK